MAADDDGKPKFSALRMAWLDQVAADQALLPMCFKLAWFLAKDCGRTFARTGEAYSFRSQGGYGTLLGLKERQVRKLFDALAARGHSETKRGGRGNPNRAYLRTYDRHYSAGQKQDMTGTPAHDDRHSSDIMTGTAVPPIFIEDISKDSQRRQKAARAETSSASSTGDSSTFPGRCDEPVLRTGSHHRNGSSYSKSRAFTDRELQPGEEIQYPGLGSVSLWKRTEARELFGRAEDGKDYEFDIYEDGTLSRPWEHIEAAEPLDDDDPDHVPF